MTQRVTLIVDVEVDFPSCKENLDVNPEDVEVTATTWKGGVFFRESRVIKVLTEQPESLPPGGRSTTERSQPRGSRDQ